MLRWSSHKESSIAAAKGVGDGLVEASLHLRELARAVEGDQMDEGVHGGRGVPHTVDKGERQGEREGELEGRARPGREGGRKRENVCERERDQKWDMY